MKLIVGLGNPGRDYAGTRHNVGFEVLDRFAAKLGLIAGPADFDRQARTNFDGLALDGPATLAGGRQERVLLLKPMTFMNLSGKSLQAAKAFYQLSDADLIVATVKEIVEAEPTEVAEAALGEPEVIGKKPEE